MAINTFTFGGVTSSTYGIYVSGEKLFNAPARDAEVIQIPGRDGDYILDKGSFKNIKVTYRVFNQEKNLSDFRTKLANLRSALCSKRGYQRLTDTFHPDEYRMAAFIDSIEVTPVKYNTASEFDITFECKPQRWLTSGETATAVANNGTLSNPTLFDASPLLEVKGYGTLNVNDSEITLNNIPLGDVYYNSKSNPSSARISVPLNDGRLNDGDTIRVTNLSYSEYITLPFGCVITNVTENITTQDFTAVLSGGAVGSNSLSFQIDAEQVTIPNTQNTTKKYVFSGNITYTDGDGVSQTITYLCQSSVTVASGNPRRIEFNTRLVTSLGSSLPDWKYIRFGEIIGDSTVSALGNPTYIDCDIGIAYRLNGGVVIDLNNATQLPIDLPMLPVGTSTFTYDNTITELKVQPRWWKV